SDLLSPITVKFLISRKSGILLFLLAIILDLLPILKLFWLPIRNGGHSVSRSLMECGHLPFGMKETENYFWRVTDSVSNLFIISMRKMNVSHLHQKQELLNTSTNTTEKLMIPCSVLTSPTLMP